MDARHLIGPGSRRGRANLLSALALAGTVALATWALDPTGGGAAARRPGVIGSPGAGVVLASTPEESVVIGPDGTLVTVPTSSGADPTKEPVGPGRYHASASASLGYAGVGTEGTGSSVGVAAVGVSSDGAPYRTHGSLGALLFGGPVAGRTAIGRSDVAPGYDGLAVEASSPGGTGAVASGVVDPETVPLGLRALGGQVAANTVGSDACVASGPVVEASAELAGGNLLPGLGPSYLGAPEREDGSVDVLGIDGAGSSTASIELGRAEVVDEEFRHTPAPSIAVTARAKVRVPTITLFPGTFYKTELRLLAPLEITATAGGVPGTARAHVYGLILDPDRPILAVTAYFGTHYLTGRYFQTEHGIRLDLGNGAAIELGAATLESAAGGRSARGTLDVLRLRLPDRLGVPAPKSSPDLLEEVTGYPSGIGPVLDTINAGFAALPLPSVPLPAGSVQEVRLGHMEVEVAVPSGGVRCKLDEPNDHEDFGIKDEDTGHETGL